MSQDGTPLKVFVCLLAGLALACSTQNVNLHEKKCDDAHPCAAGWACFEGLCIETGECAGAGASCTVGVGECVRAGIGICSGESLACSASPGSTATEICDGKDNDCNGTVDDTHPVALTGVRQTGGTQTTVSLGWDLPDSSLQTLILLRDGVQLAELPATAVTFVDTGLLPGETHEYAVTPRDVCNVTGSPQILSAQTNPPTAPEVTFTAPAQNSNISVGGTVTFTLSVSVSIGRTVKSVEILQGTTVLCTFTGPPYSCPWTGNTDGSYSFSARALDNADLLGTSLPHNVTVSAPPTVVITSPAAGFNVTSGTPITVDASASVGTGRTVAKVVIYRSSTVICTDTVSPYSCTWTNPSDGVTGLKAIVTDSANVSATSSIVNVTVSAMPTVTLTSPSNGATYTSPASVTLSATATSGTGRGVANVEFYQGTTLLNRDTSSPYSYVWSGVTNGTYNITARVTDTGGASKDSSVATITVGTAPGVALTSPSNGKTYYAPTTVSLSATASASSGRTVARVEFYRGTTLIQSDTSAPYAFDWTAVGSGTYDVTAKVIDSAGASVTSTMARITVMATPMTTIAFRSSAVGTANNSATVSVSKPTGVVSGDFMLLRFMNSGAATASPVHPSGWTWFGTENTTKMVSWLYYKRAGASEPTTYSFSQSVAANLAAEISVFTGVSSTTPVDVNEVHYADNTSALIGPEVVTNTNNGLALWLPMQDHSPTSTCPSAFTVPAGSTEIREDCIVAATNGVLFGSSFRALGAAGLQPTLDGSSTISATNFVQMVVLNAGP